MNKHNISFIEKDDHPLIKNDIIQAGIYRKKHINFVIKHNPKYIWWCCANLFEPSFFFSLSSQSMKLLFEQPNQ